jgi:hypothetical protein
MYSFLFDLLPKKITPADTPSVNPEYLSIRDEIFHAIIEHFKKPKKLQLFSQLFKIIKKMIKCILPYGLVRLIQEIKKKLL